jgi:carbon-monoxide dehydrogenase small subunit
MSRLHVTATVNGEPVEFLAGADQSLLDALRDELGLTRQQGGLRQRRLRRLLGHRRRAPGLRLPGLRAEAQGRSIQTVEGLAEAGAMHPLQQQFLEHAALQCGFCTPGFLVAAKALLDRNPDPPRPRSATRWPATCAAAPATTRSCAPCRPPPPRCAPRRAP